MSAIVTNCPHHIDSPSAALWTSAHTHRTHVEPAGASASASLHMPLRMSNHALLLSVASWWL